MEIQESIKKIVTGQDLSRKEISSIMNQILTGTISEAQIGAFLAVSYTHLTLPTTPYV